MLCTPPWCKRGCLSLTEAFKRRVLVQPANFGKAAIAIAVGLLIKFAIPCPAELTAQAWSLLAIFVTTIVGVSHLADWFAGIKSHTASLNKPEASEVKVASLAMAPCMRWQVHLAAVSCCANNFAPHC